MQVPNNDSIFGRTAQHFLYCLLQILLTFNEVVVSFAPAVAVAGGEDANRLFVGLQR